jgi:hypothetical protein
VCGGALAPGLAGVRDRETGETFDAAPSGTASSMSRNPLTRMISETAHRAHQLRRSPALRPEALLELPELEALEHLVSPRPREQAPIVRVEAGPEREAHDAPAGARVLDAREQPALWEAPDAGA